MENILNFLKLLNKNNNREWFNTNKTLYEHAKQEFEFAVNILITKIREFDKRVDVIYPKDCMFRIYHDTRFSKNKEPYKDHFGAFIASGGRKSKYSGYYIHIQEENSFVGGGLYMPDNEILQKIRLDILENSDYYKQILEAENFKKYFSDIWGERLKTVPRGFPKDFKDAELLKLKSHALWHTLPAKILSSPDLLNYTVNVFRSMLDFNNYFNEIIDK